MAVCHELSRLPQGALAPFRERLQVLYAQMEPRPGDDDDLCFDGRVVDEKGRVYLEMNGYRTARLPTSIDPEQVAPLKAAVAD